MSAFTDSMAADLAGTVFNTDELAVTITMNGASVVVLIQDAADTVSVSSDRRTIDSEKKVTFPFAAPTVNTVMTLDDGQMWTITRILSSRPEISSVVIERSTTREVTRAGSYFGRG